MKAIDWIVTGLGLATAGAFWFLRRKPEPEPEPLPVKQPTKADEGVVPAAVVAPPVTKPPAPAPSSGAYRTPVDRVTVQAPGWFPLPSGGRVTVFPLVDTETGLYARLDYPGAIEAARRLGGRILTKTQVDELARIGFWTRPCTLVHKQADFAKMQSIEFARKHDECMNAQLGGWDGKTPVLGGKDYIEGAPNGRQLEYGWSKSPGKVDMIQPPGSAHEASYTDYSQLTRVWVP